MIVAAAIAILGLLVIAVASRAGDGRAETAIALPLAATVALWNGYAALAVLAGAGAAYAALVWIERRTLLYGRRLRAVAAAVGAVVPLGALAGAWLLGPGWPHPEVWLVGSVVPGVLAYDLRRQSPRRRPSLAVGGAAILGSLAFSGLVLQATTEPAPIDRSLLPPAGTAPEASLLVLAPVVAVTLALAVGARWRYGLHVGAVSVPLLAVWVGRSPAVLAAYLGAAALTAVALGPLRERVPLYGRRLSAVGATVGAVAGLAVAALGAPTLPALLAGALAAEDRRLLAAHAGRDRLDAAAIGLGLFAVPAVLLAAARGAPEPALAVAGVVAALAGSNAARTALRRERTRPADADLRAAERRWVP